MEAWSSDAAVAATIGGDEGGARCLISIAFPMISITFLCLHSHSHHRIINHIINHIIQHGLKAVMQCNPSRKKDHSVLLRIITNYF
jgi:hypothetical protein